MQEQTAFLIIIKSLETKEKTTMIWRNLNQTYKNSTLEITIYIYLTTPLWKLHDKLHGRDIELITRNNKFRLILSY